MQPQHQTQTTLAAGPTGSSPAPCAGATSSVSAPAAFLTREQVIEHLCQTVALAYHSIGDYSRPSDGFCDRCPVSRHPHFHFQHAGETLRYVREAVLTRLYADGFKINEGFDAFTGDEITTAKE